MAKHLEQRNRGTRQYWPIRVWSKNGSCRDRNHQNCAHASAGTYRTCSVGRLFTTGPRWSCCLWLRCPSGTRVLCFCGALPRLAMVILRFFGEFWVSEALPHRTIAAWLMTPSEVKGRSAATARVLCVYLCIAVSALLV